MADRFFHALNFMRTKFSKAKPDGAIHEQHKQRKDAVAYDLFHEWVGLVVYS